MNNTKKEPPLKLIVLGDKSVGKTSILTQYCHNLFINKYQPTDNYQFFTNQVDYNGKKNKLQIWDIAGQKSKDYFISETFLLNTICILLVYDITDYNSFKNLNKIIDSIKKSKNFNQNLYLFIVGNKNDLQNREVHITEGETFAKESNAIFMEISSKKSNEINTLFLEIIKNITLFDPKKVQLIDDDAFCCNNRCC